MVEGNGRPLVTAFMPLLNAEAFLEPALESLLAQDYEQFEIVACDDGSTDRTREILSRYPTIKTVIHDENRGRAAACNTAIAASSGTLLASFDGDDLWPQNRLSLQVAFFDEHPGVDCVLGRQEWMDAPPWLGRDEVYGDLDGIPLVSMMIRRTAFDAIGGFDESFRYSEDMDLLVRLREHRLTMEVLPEIVVYRRYHGGQMTATPPTTLPLLRSIRQKLERERAGDEA